MYGDIIICPSVSDQRKYFALFITYHTMCKTYHPFPVDFYFFLKQNVKQTLLIVKLALQ